MQWEIVNFYFFIKIRIKPTIFNGSFALKFRYSTENGFGRTEPNRDFLGANMAEPRICREWRRLAEPNRTEPRSRFGSVRPNPRLGLTLVRTFPKADSAPLNKVS